MVIFIYLFIYLCRYAPHNDVSSNDGPHIQRWSHKNINHHHHKHKGLDPLIHSVSRVRVARANISTVFQFFSFVVVCSGVISKGFGFMAFFASVKAKSVCIHLSCLVCL